jgi:hypothetical protein
MTVSAERPWRTALQRERSFPSRVTGPVLLSALRWLAAICLSELLALQQLASFWRRRNQWSVGTLDLSLAG